MTTGKRIKFFRNLRKMTMRELGIAVGFPAHSADIRISQYENTTRTPKNALSEAIASVLNVSPHALRTPDLDNENDVLHMFFLLEDKYGFKINCSNDHIFLMTDKDSSLSPSLRNALQLWSRRYEALKHGEICKDDYDSWRYNFPGRSLNSSENGHTLNCSQFDCLLHVADLCEKYPSCDGCGNLYACRVCSSKEAVISHRSAVCTLINLENRCRCCLKRNLPDFSHAECIRCRDE